MTELAERSTADILDAAKFLISDPTRWTKGSHAKTENGDPTDPNAENACKWCALGSVIFVMGGRWYDAEEEPWKYLDLVATDMLGTNYTYLMPPAAQVNETMPHGTVMEMFDAAIAAAREDEGLEKD